MFSMLFWADGEVKVLTFILLMATIPLLLEVWLSSHYMVAVFATLIALGFRLLLLCHELSWREFKPGILLATVLLLAALGFVGVVNVWHARQEALDPDPHRLKRDRVEHELMGHDGLQVVFVRYATKHYVHVEWVYNGAAIDKQKVIWARDLGPDQDRQLINYYPGRHFWIVDAESPDPKPVRYQLYQP
jgi:energy-coupling factor transporter transmembrane protein EcfT